MATVLRMGNQPNIRSYAQAEACFETAIERKGAQRGTSGTHKLAKYLTGIAGVSKVGDQIRFTYHTTDVAVWHPWGVELDLGYRSLSTAVFASRFMPTNTRVYNEGRFLQAIVPGGEAAYYLPRDRVRIYENGVLSHPEADTRPIERVRINRKLASAARKDYALAEFTEYYLAARKMLGERQCHAGLPDGAILEPVVTQDNFIELLQDKAKWGLFVYSGIAGWRASAKGFLTYVQQQVYEHASCYYTEVYPYVTRYADLNNWVAE